MANIDWLIAASRVVRSGLTCTLRAPTLATHMLRCMHASITQYPPRSGRDYKYDENSEPEGKVNAYALSQRPLRNEGKGRCSHLSPSPCVSGMVLRARKALEAGIKSQQWDGYQPLVAALDCNVVHGVRNCDVPGILPLEGVWYWMGTSWCTSGASAMLCTARAFDSASCSMDEMQMREVNVNIPFET